jgi:hypothetical protein
MKKSIVNSVIVIILLVIARLIYSAFSGPIEGATAVNQLSDNTVTYGLSRAVAQGLIPTLMNWAAVVMLILIWARHIKNSKKGVVPVAIIIFATLYLTGCGPAKIEPVVEISPNETVFVVPMEGNTDAQGKFMSIEYLEHKKVAAKRITLSLRERSTGRMWWDYEWLPTDRVIKVDRSPVTREWTKAANTGTSISDQAVRVESSESIDFMLGVTCQAYISEEDASKFLYFYSGKPLSEVMDQNIRGYIQKILFNEFGSRTLTDDKASKKQIFTIVENETKKFFNTKGVTIDYIGGAEGMTYTDGRVQTAINDAFVAENDRKVATEQQEATKTRNATLVMVAVAERKAGEEFQKSQEAQVRKIELGIRQTYAEATKIAANKYQGGMPGGILPQGSSFLFGLDGTFGGNNFSQSAKK